MALRKRHEILMPVWVMVTFVDFIFKSFFQLNTAAPSFYRFGPWRLAKHIKTITLEPRVVFAILGQTCQVFPDVFAIRNQAASTIYRIIVSHSVSKGLEISLVDAILVVLDHGVSNTTLIMIYSPSLSIFIPINPWYDRLKGYNTVAMVSSGKRPVPTPG